jgi:hypothetical protein
MARSDYGYDAPYALIMFACAGTGTAHVALFFLSKGLPHGAVVLKPGGGLAIAEIRAPRVYADALRRLGAFDVLRRRLG